MLKNKQSAVKMKALRPENRRPAGVSAVRNDGQNLLCVRSAVCSAGRTF